MLGETTPTHRFTSTFTSTPVFLPITSHPTSSFSLFSNSPLFSYWLLHLFSFILFQFSSPSYSSIHSTYLFLCCPLALIYLVCPVETRDRALLAFSVRRNWDALVSTKADSLPVIHGVRSVFTVMLFAAHKLMPLALIPYSNRSLLTQVGKWFVERCLCPPSSVTSILLLKFFVLQVSFQDHSQLSCICQLSWRFYG